MSDILIGFIIGIVAGAIGVALDTHRKKRLGIKDEPKVKPYKPPKRRQPTERMYRDFYRTGDRRFLYDRHYKKKGYNDHNYQSFYTPIVRVNRMNDILIGFIIGIVAGAIGVALDTHRKKRLGIKDEPRQPKPKKYKADWVSRENYNKFLRTGDRNYLWKKDYKRRNEY